MSPHLLTESQEKNLISFLETQKECLEYIYFDKCVPKVIEFIFNKMENLKTIRFDFNLQEPKFDVKELNLTPNEKIETFELAYVKLFDDLKDYLDLVKNAKNLLIGHMNPRVLQYISDLPNLETVVFRYDDCAGSCDAQYENLKKENQELINKNIKMSVCNDFL
jgi:Cft2 family RNA processing exonuclease